jgi:protein arginine kinase activator
MLCQNCQKRAANVHFSQIINNNKIELHFCNICAKEKGYINIIEPINISDFLSSLLGYGTVHQVQPYQPEKEACVVCGMTFEDFQKTGKLGCYNCYNLFGDKLKPVLKNLHGSLNHNGKLPIRMGESIKISKETKKLRDELDAAVRNEEYERAAELRDKIKLFEKDG